MGLDAEVLCNFQNTAALHKDLTLGGLPRAICKASRLHLFIPERRLRLLQVDHETLGSPKGFEPASCSWSASSQVPSQSRKQNKSNGNLPFLQSRSFFAFSRFLLLFRSWMTCKQHETCNGLLARRGDYPHDAAKAFNGRIDFSLLSNSTGTRYCVISTNCGFYRHACAWP